MCLLEMIHKSPVQQWMIVPIKVAVHQESAAQNACLWVLHQYFPSTSSVLVVIDGNHKPEIVKTIKQCSLIQFVSVRRWKKHGDLGVQIIEPLEKIFRCFNSCNFGHINGLLRELKQARPRRRSPRAAEWSKPKMDTEAIECLSHQLFRIPALHQPRYIAFWVDEKFKDWSVHEGYPVEVESARTLYLHPGVFVFAVIKAQAFILFDLDQAFPLSDEGSGCSRARV
jgi:hypothetical protein